MLRRLPWGALQAMPAGFFKDGSGSRAVEGVLTKDLTLNASMARLERATQLGQPAILNHRAAEWQILSAQSSNVPFAPDKNVPFHV